MDLEELVRDHQSSLYAFLFRMTGDHYLAEDLMQDTFVRALRASKGYRPRGRFSAWLFSIAVNLARDHWRKVHSRGSTLPVPGGNAGANPVQDLVEMSAGVERLRKALLTLPFDQRAPLILFYYHDVTYEDIAKCLVIPVGTVRSRIHNAKARLGRILEGGCQGCE